MKSKTINQIKKKYFTNFLLITLFTHTNLLLDFLSMIIASQSMQAISA
jgi:hypothetical protein